MASVIYWVLIVIIGLAVGVLWAEIDHHINNKVPYNLSPCAQAWNFLKRKFNREV